MLTVVIAIMFIVLLGTALLTASYLGFAVTMTERSGQRNFYDASTAMDDIRAYVHTQSSDALARAYTDTLKNYSTNKKTAGYDAQADFSQKFVAELESNTSGFITKAANNTYQANLSALQAQLKPPTGDSAVLSAANGGPIALDSTGNDGNPEGVALMVSIPANQLAATDRTITPSPNSNGTYSGTLAGSGNSTGVVYSVATNPAHGSVTVNADGTFTYTPTAGYVGTDTFSYKICDVNAPANCVAATATLITDGLANTGAPPSQAVILGVGALIVGVALTAIFAHRRRGSA